MAKLARERALQEKRERKQQKKEARKQAAAAEKAAEEGDGIAQADQVDLPEPETT
jgi:hypothetical protein